MKDKGLFFLILSFGAIWLVLDQFCGNKLIEQFVGNILPSSSVGTSNMSTSNISASGKGTADLLTPTGEQQTNILGDKLEWNNETGKPQVDNTNVSPVTQKAGSTLAEKLRDSIEKAKNNFY